MADKLVEIEWHNWSALRDLYAPNSAKTFLGHSCVDNFIRWTAQQPDLPNLTIYSLNGDWSDGTYAVVYKYFLYGHTLAATSERVEKLMQLIDFSKGMYMLSVQSKDQPAVLNVVKSKNLQTAFVTQNSMLYLPAEEALKFDTTPPEGITLKPVQQSDVHIADEVWPNRNEITLELLRELAKFSPSVGAYDENGRMIAWVFRLHTGPLLALQVDKEFYGRGLGMLVTKAISRKIAEIGQGIGACVFDTNVHSMAIFKKLGFSITDKVHSTHTLPT